METAERRAELGRFLRARRASLLPSAVGLPSGRRRRTPGLRREEVAALAGIGVTWYARLEQGRARGISTQALDAISRALCLSPAAHTHLSRLARESPSTTAAGTAVSPGLRAAVIQIHEYPAYVFNDRWDLLLCNQAVKLVIGEISQAPDGRPNLLWWLFTSPAPRQLYVNWENTACYVLADFQVSYAHHAGDPRYVQLVEVLREKSPEFAAWWASYELRQRGEWSKEIEHPIVGRLVLEELVSVPEGQTELRLLLQPPEPGSESAEKLARLLATAPEVSTNARVGGPQF